MKKWSLLLAFALLFNMIGVRAEENTYYTNKQDRYYHADADCDRPAETNWWSNVPVEYYERDAYRKYKISETAAVEFQKNPCPICVKRIEPVYLGDHFPQWPYETGPWDLGKISLDEREAFYSGCPQQYIDEMVGTSRAFYVYYEEIYNQNSGQVERRHAYPDAYAGCYTSDSECTSYAIVDPDEEILAAFERMFGGGAWIVPAKYGYDEIMRARERVMDELREWCAAHPEVDAGFASATGPDYENCAVIGIFGADWKQAAAAMEDTAPIYIHFTYEEVSVVLEDAKFA